MENSVKSFQTRLEERFEALADQHGCELVQQVEWANAGQLIAWRGDKIAARAHYDIQSGISKVWFNGADHLKPWLTEDKDDLSNGVGPEIVGALDGRRRRRNPDVFYFQAYEADLIGAMFGRWDRLLGS